MPWKLKLQKEATETSREIMEHCSMDIPRDRLPVQINRRSTNNEQLVFFTWQIEELCEYEPHFVALKETFDRYVESGLVD